MKTFAEMKAKGEGDPYIFLETMNGFLQNYGFPYFPPPSDNSSSQSHPHQTYAAASTSPTLPPQVVDDILPPISPLHFSPSQPQQKSNTPVKTKSYSHANTSPTLPPEIVEEDLPDLTPIESSGNSIRLNLSLSTASPNQQNSSPGSAPILIQPLPCQINLQLLPTLNPLFHRAMLHTNLNA